MTNFRSVHTQPLPAEARAEIFGKWKSGAWRKVDLASEYGLTVHMVSSIIRQAAGTDPTPNAPVVEPLPTPEPESKITSGIELRVWCADDTEAAVFLAKIAEGRRLLANHAA